MAGGSTRGAGPRTRGWVSPGSGSASAISVGRCTCRPLPRKERPSWLTFPSAASMRVLLADDHALFREGLRLILERAGHEVAGEAADGHEACKLARTLSPDIAVLDLSMPL